MPVPDSMGVLRAAVDGGWLPPANRSKRQQRLVSEWHEAIGEQLASVGDVPDQVIFGALQKAKLGAPLPRIRQLTGSCVGAGSGQAQANATFCDVHFRRDREDVKLPFFPAPYGVGRKLAGMRSRGEGSFGAAQAKAVQPEHFGILPFDHPGVPRYTEQDGWVQYTEAIELAWSYSPQWEHPEAELKQQADDFGLQVVTQITSTDAWLQALAQGRPVTLASMFGTRKPVVRGDVLIADWDGQWAHQMSSSGYWRHPQHGVLFLIDNQWGPTVHGDCPTLAPIGIRGSFWIREQTAAKILQEGEVYAHSGTGGFNPRKLDWSDMWRFTDATDSIEPASAGPGDRNCWGPVALDTGEAPDARPMGAQ